MRAALLVTLSVGLMSIAGGHPRLGYARVATERATNGDSLIAALRCGACHTGVFAPAGALVPLAQLGARYSRRGLFSYLRHSHRGPRGSMPDFRLGDRERLALVRFLLPGEDGRGDGAARPDGAAPDDSLRYERVRGNATSPTPRDGQRIAIALNCAGCHTIGGTPAWLNATDLAREGERARPEWLRAYLRHPTRVRPFGAFPGSGSRMPDYALDSSQAGALATALLARVSGSRAASLPSLSRFDADKAEQLMRDRYPCLGCHRLGSSGGRIAPAFDNIGARRPASFVRSIIADPQHAVPGSVMPRTIMPEETVDLLAAFLLQREPQSDTAPALDLLASLSVFPLPGRDSTALYRRYCATCHGATGRGDGYNARFLPVPPANHTDSTYFSRRADGTVYDAIGAGGYVLGRSNRMPAFGATLSPAEIRALVAKIHALCRCDGPAWSHDDATSHD